MAAKNKPNQVQETPLVEARIDRLLDGDFKTKAYASATIAGAFAVHGMRVIESEKGRFISMPQDSYKKGGETKYSESDWDQMTKFQALWSKKFYDVLVPYLVQ